MSQQPQIRVWRFHGHAPQPFGDVSFWIYRLRPDGGARMVLVREIVTVLQMAEAGFVGRVKNVKGELIKVDRGGALMKKLGAAGALDGLYPQEGDPVYSIRLSHIMAMLPERMEHNRVLAVLEEANRDLPPPTPQADQEWRGVPGGPDGADQGLIANKTIRELQMLATAAGAAGAAAEEHPGGSLQGHAAPPPGFPYIPTEGGGYTSDSADDDLPSTATAVIIPRMVHARRGRSGWVIIVLLVTWASVVSHLNHTCNLSPIAPNPTQASWNGKGGCLSGVQEAGAHPGLSPAGGGGWGSGGVHGVTDDVHGPGRRAAHRGTPCAITNDCREAASRRPPGGQR